MSGVITSPQTRRRWTSMTREGHAIESENGQFRNVQTVSWNNQRTTSAQKQGWRALKAQGKDVTTTLVAHRCTERKSLIEQTIRFPLRPLQVDRYTGQLYMPPVPGTTSSSLDNQARSEAEIKFAKKVRSRTQQWASGQFFGELRETASFLRRPVRGIVDKSAIVLKQLKHARRKTFGGKTVEEILKLQKTARYKALQRQVNDLYLSWEYAVKPLANDANDAANAFEKLARGHTPGIRFHATGKASSGSLGSWQSLPANSAGWPSYGVGGRLLVEDTCEVTIRGVMQITTAGGEIPPLMQFGLDSSSWVPTFYEILPYSFLLDYVSNTGDVLNAWSLRFIAAVWMNETVRRVRKHSYAELEYRREAGPSTSLVTQLQLTRVGSNKRYYVERKSRKNDFAPSFAAEIPGFGSKKWINIASLALAMRQART